MHLPHFNWVLLGAITGVFWGIYALFFYMPEYKERAKNAWESARRVFTGIFQFIYNFICGFAGWFCLKIFLKRLSWGYFGFSELILLCIALLGISGRLSPIMFHLPGALMKKLNDWLGFKN